MQSIPPSQPNPVWAGIHTLIAQTREPEPDFKQLFFFFFTKSHAVSGQQRLI